MKRELLVRLFPPQWRARYGGEFLALLDELPASPRLIFDVTGAALRARLSELIRSLRSRRVAGGPEFDPERPHAKAYVALALMLPSLALLSTFALKFKLGIADPFDTTWSVFADRVRVLQYVAVFAPWLSLLLAGQPLLRVSFHRSAAGSSINLSPRMHALNLAIALLSVAAIYLFGRYFIDQNMLLPLWRDGPSP